MALHGARADHGRDGVRGDPDSRTRQRTPPVPVRGASDFRWNRFVGIPGPGESKTVWNTA